jgi:hypothetical protein
MTPAPAGYIDEEVVVDGVRAIRRRRISVRRDTGNLSPPKAQWARFPLPWIVALRQTKSASTKQLAMEILFADFRRKYTNGEIVLSAATTGLPHSTRAAATRELVRLGLIEVEQHGWEAARVIRLNAG